MPAVTADDRLFRRVALQDITASNGEARRCIRAGNITVNNLVCIDEMLLVHADDVVALRRAGQSFRPGTGLRIREPVFTALISSRTATSMASLADSREFGVFDAAALTSSAATRAASSDSSTFALAGSGKALMMAAKAILAAYICPCRWVITAPIPTCSATAFSMGRSHSHGEGAEGRWATITLGAPGADVAA